ncbi:tetratricopeptide repeat protein [Gimesia sp.]|uniref:tetratricopeptide repeat protein n=1 Tax=Gimesia sp. TaxID=2024833 RepID=UPI003A929D65
MVIWPFRKKTYEELTTEELRARLISAAGKSRKELRALCKHYQDQIAANIELMSRVPEGIDQSPEAMNQYVQKLGTVAHCLATDFQSPELWNSLVGSPEDNPLLQWNQWNEALPQRMENLEYEDLISELRSFLEEFKTLEGPAARQNEAVIHGKLGELLFQSGKVADAIQPFQTALTLCQESNDIEGQMAYLNNLLEAHRYLGNTELAIESGEGLLPLYDQFGIDKTALTKRIQLLKTGEPLCRIICVHEDTELETDEIVNAPEGRFEFQFKRNRLPLQKATSLIQQGNVLASEGQLAEALEKYH